MLDPMDYFQAQMPTPDFTLQQANPLNQYATDSLPMQMAAQNMPAQPVNLTGQNGVENPDWLTQLAPDDNYSPPVSPVMQMAQPQPDYAPTTGSQMEADSRNSIDKIIAHMTEQRSADRQNDRNLQWMTFFSKLASSKSPTLLGGLGEGAEALSDVTGKQAQTNKLLDQSSLEDQLKVEQWKQEERRQLQALAQTGAYQKGELALKAKELELGKYQPVKDVFGNVTGIFDARAGKMVPMASATALGDTSTIDMTPSADPQAAAQQILDEQGTPFVPVASRQDVTGRNAQAKAYNDQALAAKSIKQQLDALDSQTGKYRPGKVAGYGYGAESSLGVGGEGATARTEAEKASKQLANSFMQANVGAKGAGIRMVEFDAGAVPNPDMTDEARKALIQKNKAVADSQIQRNVISSLYPRLHLSNVNAIMDNYEAKNPPILPNGEANPHWMTYQDWLKAGRPNTTTMAPAGDAPSAPKQGAPDYSHLWGQ